jgi:hypothetical protein
LNPAVSVLFKRLLLIGMLALLWGGPNSVAEIATVHFVFHAARDVRPISRYIYGVNQFQLFFDGMDGPWSNATFTRLGGDRFTAYNWTNSASQAGNDFHWAGELRTRQARAFACPG